MEKIIIYTNEKCPYCKQVKEELTKNKIEFENRFTKDSEEEWKNIINLTVMGNVPTLHYKNSYLTPGRDFANPQALLNLLKNFEELNFSETRQILERTKTLNYNILMAFNRLDQLLRQIETKLNTDEHKSTD